MKKIKIGIFIFALLLVTTLTVFAADIPLGSGESGSLNCEGDELAIVSETVTRSLYNCIVYTPTPTSIPTTEPQPTATATMTPTHSHSATWHEPGVHGDVPAHDHGDAPPQWLLDAGYAPSFDHPANTPNENVLAHKHSAMKGAGATFGLKDSDPANNVDWYGIFHLDFNPGGHFNRFHSYQLWLLDATGAVSHISGWFDFGTGNETGPQIVIVCNTGTAVRPVMKINQSGCTPVFETWYALDSSPTFDIGITISANYFAGGDPNNPASWQSIDGTVRNMNRRFEFSYYGVWGGQNLRGDFWTTQFGDSVSGPTDPICDGFHTRPVGERTYTLLCVKQTLQPTLPQIKFVTGNSVQRIFPSGGVTLQLPN